MKCSIASLAIFCLALVAIPASAQVLYDNGPINGTTDAWVINFGYIVSDTFTLMNSSTVGGFDFGVWELPGDVLLSIDWSITTAENGGTVFGSGSASGSNLTDRFISNNQFGYNIDEVTVAGLNVALSGGTYWLNLHNAMVPNGDPVFWDENYGVGCGGSDGKGSNCLSMASESALGTLFSESFTITGSGTTPEPSSVMLFGSGILGLAGLVRRKLF